MTGAEEVKKRRVPTCFLYRDTAAYFFGIVPEAEREHNLKNLASAKTRGKECIPNMPENQYERSLEYESAP